MRLPFALVLATAGLCAGHAAASTPAAHATDSAPPLRVQSAYPVVVTSQMTQCRDFYVRRLGFRVEFEASWFVYLSSGGDHPYAIAFMLPEHPSQPPGPEAFDGKGAFLTLQVADAAAEFERLQQAGVAIAYPLRDEPWGQRRFGLIDPAGMWVDVVQQTEPEPGYWDRFAPR